MALWTRVASPSARFRARQNQSRVSLRFVRGAQHLRSPHVMDPAAKPRGNKTEGRHPGRGAARSDALQTREPHPSSPPVLRPHSHVAAQAGTWSCLPRNRSLPAQGCAGQRKRVPRGLTAGPSTRTNHRVMDPAPEAREGSRPTSRASSPEELIPAPSAVLILLTSRQDPGAEWYRSPFACRPLFVACREALTFAPPPNGMTAVSSLWAGGRNWTDKGRGRRLPVGRDYADAPPYIAPIRDGSVACGSPGLLPITGSDGRRRLREIHPAALHKPLVGRTICDKLPPGRTP